MLTILGNSAADFCDGISRRNFLKIGSLGIAGMTLADRLRAEAQGAATSEQKAVIMLFLAGGPSQSEIFPNLEAPEAYRTSFKRIATKIPGAPICEFMPKVAAVADKMVLIPGVQSMDGGHMAFCCFSGATGATPAEGLKEKREFGSMDGRPSMGSYITKLLGSTDGATPPYMHCGQTPHWHGSGPGFLGSTYRAFHAQRSGDMKLNGISLEELEDRRSLVRSLDRLKAEVDSSALEAADAFTQKAFAVLGSKKLTDALDLRKEDPRVVDRYTNPGWGSKNWDAGVMLNLLRARRLVEAGARYVAVGYGGWDTHNANDEVQAQKLQVLDSGLATLVTDLEQRGMLEDVTLLAWGEMGRGKPYSPKPIKAFDFVGRGTGHWHNAAPAFMAGGGMRVGQMLGQLDRHGMHNDGRPVHCREVHATVWHNLGIDPETKVFDPAGRPHYVTDKPPVKELI